MCSPPPRTYLLFNLSHIKWLRANSPDNKVLRNWTRDNDTEGIEKGEREKRFQQHTQCRTETFTPDLSLTQICHLPPVLAGELGANSADPVPDLVSYLTAPQHAPTHKTPQRPQILRRFGAGAQSRTSLFFFFFRQTKNRIPDRETGPRAGTANSLLAEIQDPFTSRDRFWD